MQASEREKEKAYSHAIALNLCVTSRSFFLSSLSFHFQFNILHSINLQCLIDNKINDNHISNEKAKFSNNKYLVSLSERECERLCVRVCVLVCVYMSM